MSRPHRRSRRPHRQLDLLLAAPATPDVAPRWSSLPAPTRQALSGLLIRLMEAHAANAGLPLPRGGADEQ
ncbi:hypothetical protein [Lichenifustis flavocetrariae]|uniref:Uncharacterized protein n=1 Tax=Lichenifustis flavocetrariae TaxID=2949735 RepID=A0AA41Z3H9_9HYPH|nr:hypothetical protein [Lichenifustis flavocetrariae]MCW6512367.1 hypothetical protein [Lichenifustis flavocetrariae]